MAGDGERVKRWRREGADDVSGGERDCLCDFWSWLSASLGVMSNVLRVVRHPKPKPEWSYAKKNKARDSAYMIRTGGEDPQSGTWTGCAVNNIQLAIKRAKIWIAIRSFPPVNLSEVIVPT
jgi:hypothetical protein